MIKVLFVCLGNICRSPMAEALFKQLVDQEGLRGRFEIDSAATGPWHVGKPPHEGTMKILKKYNISSEGLICREITADDLNKFDYIIGMDNTNIENILKLACSATKNKVIKMLDLTEQYNGREVPDPYFTGDFQETYDLLMAGCQALLDKVKTEKQLNVTN